eukprot:2593139-Prymnesium_polylepis.1
MHLVMELVTGGELFDRIVAKGCVRCSSHVGAARARRIDDAHTPQRSVPVTTPRKTRRSPSEPCATRSATSTKSELCTATSSRRIC